MGAALSIAGIAASVVGTGMSVYGSIQQGQAQSRAANYQAQVAQNNATIAGQNATAVQNQAAAKGEADYRAGAIRAGAQRAAMGASGVALDSGSALDVQGATATNTALGVANDQYQGDLAGRSYLAQASNYGAQAGLDQMKASAAESAGYTNAASSFLQGASQVSSKWDAYRNTTSPATAKVANTMGVNGTGGL